MTTYDVRRMVLAFSIQAEIEGMKVANAERDLQSEAAAYSDDDFCEKSEELRLLAAKHDHEL